MNKIGRLFKETDRQCFSRLGVPEKFGANLRKSLAERKSTCFLKVCLLRDNQVVLLL